MTNPVSLPQVRTKLSPQVLRSAVIVSVIWGEDEWGADPVHLLISGFVGVVDGADDMIRREAVGSPAGERGRSGSRMIVKFLSSCRASVSSRVWKTLTRFSFTSQTTPGISGLGGGLGHAEGPRGLSERDRW